jgi:HK97 family phage major capsid protein
MELTYNQARNRLKDIQDEIERLDTKAEKSETRSLNDEDQKYWDDLVEEARAVAAHVGRLEREAQKLELRRLGVQTKAVSGRAEHGIDVAFDADPLGEPDSVEEGRFKNPWDTSELRMGLTPQARGAELRARALSAIERMQGSTAARRETSTRFIEEYDSSDGKMAQIVLATSSPEYLRAWGKLAKSQGQTHVLDETERLAVSRAMSLTDAGGGFLVPFQLDPTVINTTDGSYNEIRRIARTVVGVGDTWNGVSAGAVSWSFDAEAAEVSDDTPTFVQPSITVRQARGFVPISIEAYDDAANVTTEIGRLLAAGKDNLESVVFATGSAGSNQPIGIITALTGTSSIVTSTTTDTFAIADVYKVFNALPARYRSRSAWLANNLVYGLVRGFDTAGGAGLWTTIGNDRPEMLLGKPVYESEAMDGTVTALAENYVAVVGDFSNYVIVDRIGMTVEFIPHLFATANNLPSGQRGWFARFRVGADSVNDGAFRMLNVT